LDYAKTLDMSPDVPLFGGRKNGGRKAIARQSAYRIIKELAEKALGDSEGIGTHTMRKSFATHLYLATRDIYRVKSLLGHAFVATTERYIRYGLAMLDDTLEDLCLT
jgi:site-specific recombinase XerD